MPSESLSICVTIKNRSKVSDGYGGSMELFPQFVDSLITAARSMSNIKIELIVSDWNSQDWPLEEWLPQKIQKSTIILRIITVEDHKEKFSRGFGLNLAFKNSTGDIIFFTDADMLLSTGVLKQGIEHCLKGHAFFPICKSGLDYNDLSKFWWRVSGFGNVFVKRTDFLKAGCWFERYIWGGEDVELCARLIDVVPIIRENADGLFHQKHPNPKRSFKKSDPKEKKLIKQALFKLKEQGII